MAELLILVGAGGLTYVTLSIAARMPELKWALGRSTEVEQVPGPNA